MNTNNQITKNAKGQTTVEYILLLVVVVSVMSTVFTQLEDFMVGGPDSLQGKFLNSFKSGAQGNNDDFSGQYKYFVIRR